LPRRKRLLQLEWLDARLTPSTVTWIGAGPDTNWDTGSNWDDGAPPSATDLVVINGSYQVILSRDVSLHGLALAGGATLTTNNAVTVSGPFDFSGATLAGSGSLTTAGGMTSDGFTLVGFDLILPNGQSSVIRDGYFYLENNSQIDNHGTLSFLNSPVVRDTDSTGLFHNESDGVVQSSGIGTNDYSTIIMENFVNDGSIDVVQGTLQIGYAQAGQTLIDNGSVQVAANASILTQCMVSASAASSFTSSGTVEIDRAGADLKGSFQSVTSVFDGSSVTISGTVNSFGTLDIYHGATVDLSTANLLPGSTILAGLDLEGNLITGANLSVASHAYIVGSLEGVGGQGSLTAGGGVLSYGFTLVGFDLILPNGQSSVIRDGYFYLENNSQIDNHGTLSFLNSPILVGASGGVGLTTEGMLTVAGGTINNLSIVNTGSVAWTGGTVQLFGNSSFTNKAGATFDDQIDGTFGGNGSCCAIFANQGSFLKSGGTGTTYLQMQLNNSGTVSIAQGILSLGCGYVQGSGGSISGSVSGTITNPGTYNSGPSSGPQPLLTSYTQTVTGTLYEQIGGLIAGTQYGQIIVNGNVNLAGSLQVALINGFIPVNGNKFIIIENQGSNPISGTFTNLAEGATVWDVTHTDCFTISYAGNDGNDVVLTAQQTATTTTVAASANPSVLNQNVTFTAVVIPQAGSTLPTGTVQFQIDGVNSGNPVTLSGGQGNFTTSALAVGTHTITALYSGNGNFLASSGALTQTVLSAQQQNAFIVTQVSALVSAGVLSSGNRNALTVKLISATASLNAGNSTTGVNQLNAFINQVAAFQKAGKLSSAQAQALINAGNLAIAAVPGNGAHLLNDAGGGTSSTGDGAPVSWAGELLTGTVGVVLENSDGTAVPVDEQACFDAAIAALDSTFGAYGVDLVDVGAAKAADAVVQVDIAATSAAGSAADGVLGCTFAGQITLVTGWNWYTGADPNAIETDQYDFQTIVTHELGHAIGLGHSGDTNSVMYAYLAPGAVRRGVTAQDLSVLDSHGDNSPEPLTAAAWRGGTQSAHQGLELHRARPTTPTILSSASSLQPGPPLLSVVSSPEAISLSSHSRLVPRSRINRGVASSIYAARSAVRRVAQALDHRAVDALLSKGVLELSPTARGFRE
jgi:hypothetical protein